MGICLFNGWACILGLNRIHCVCCEVDMVILTEPSLKQFDISTRRGVPVQDMRIHFRVVSAVGNPGPCMLDSHHLLPTFLCCT